jgi:hypothetical protein
MVVANLLAGSAVLTLGVLSSVHAVELWHLIVASAISGVSVGIFAPAFSAVIPEVVPADLLPQANALLQSVRLMGLQFLGPAFGGVLVGVIGPGGAFLLDGASFVIAAYLLRRIETGRRAPGGRVSVVQTGIQIRAGFGYARSQKWLLGTLGVASFAWFVFWGPYEVLVPYVVKNSLGGGPTAFGLILAMGGIAAIASSIAIAQVGLPSNPFVVMYASWSIALGALVGFGVARSLWQMVLISVVLNGLMAYATLVWRVIVQQLIPPSYLGRISSIDWLIGTSLIPISFALVGPIGNSVGPRHTLIIAGICGALVTGVVGVLPVVRRSYRSTVRAAHENAMQAAAKVPVS